LSGVEAVVVKFQQEFLTTVEADIKPLLVEHWHEVAVNQDVIKLNPDWDRYHELEGLGHLRIFTAREGLDLVGYFAVIVGTNLHYKDHLFAANDVIYLSPSHRKGFTGVKLIKFAMKYLKQDGVSVLAINTKVQHPFDSLMKFLGFTNVERVYSKYIGG
jgi:GNAT superfamily N-acetyltransferase